ncbi:MAG: DUF1990 domain-containing protein [Planctomycetales bacterium]|nr:DUF1990 domain-containing protein [Planctomycetales bacterium]
MRTLRLQKPEPDVLSQFVAEQSGLDFSYAAVGATAKALPDGFVVDRTRIELGAGESVFLAAKSALQTWRQFRLGWLDVWPPETPLEAGQVVAILARSCGLWWLNSCRIVYTVDVGVVRPPSLATPVLPDDPGETTQFGFAYGTLPGHMECGEERFLIEWDHRTDGVAYDILAFSKPNHILSRVGYPLVRRQQKRFGRESAASMFRAVNGSSNVPVVS